MSRPNLSPQTILLLIITIFMFIAFGVYYYWYVSERQEYLTARNLELLTRVGNQIQSRLEGVISGLKPRLQAIASPDQKEIKIGVLPKNSLRYSDLIPDIYNIQAEKILDTTALRRGITNDNSGYEMNASSDSVLFVSMSSTDEGILLTLNYYQRIKGNAWIRVIVQLKGIEQMLESLKSEEIFDEVFFAKDDGSIVVHPPAEAHSLTKIDSVTDDNGRSIPFKLYSRSDGVVSYATGGENHKLFVHPITTPTYSGLNRPPVTPEGWVICGLEKSRAFTSESLKIPYNYVIALGIISIGLLLSWPFLKLRFMGRYEKIRIVDVVFVSLSLAFGSALATMIFLDRLTSIQLNVEIDDQLKGLADSLDTRFDREVKDVFEKMETFRGEWRTDSIFRKSVNSGKILPCYNNGGYMFFDMIHWEQDDGKVIVNAAMGPHKPDTVNIKDRDYFLNAKEKLLLGIGKPDTAFTMEAVFAKNTGEFSVTLAHPSDTTKNSNISGIDFRPLSLMDPVLPSGYGFCIIDDKGEVVFHSKSDRNLQENFFSEVDNPNEFKAGITSRGGEIVSGSYWGKPHRFYFMPMKGLPWHVVTFFEIENERLVRMETISVALLLFWAYLIPFLLLFLIMLFLHRNHMGWVWPNSERRWIYYKLSLFYFFLIFFLIVLPSAISLVCKDQCMVAVLGCAMIIPQIGFVFTYLALQHHGNQERRVDFSTLGILGKIIIACLIHLIILLCILFAFPLPGPEGRLILGIYFLCYVIGLFILRIKKRSILRFDKFFYKKWGKFTKILCYVILVFMLRIMKRNVPRIDKFFYKKWGKFFKFHVAIHRVGLRFSNIYSIAVSAAIVLGVIVPSIIFFRLAYSLEFKYYYRSQLLDITHSLESRTKRIVKEYSEDTIRGRHEWITQRLNDKRDEYYNTFYSTIMDTVKADPSEYDSPTTFLDSLLVPMFVPSFNGFFLSPKSLRLNPPDSSYKWRSWRDNSPGIKRNHPLAGLSYQDLPDTLRLKADWKSLARILSERSFLQHVLIWLSALVVLLMLFYLIRFLAVGVFLLNIDPLSRLRPKCDLRVGRESSQEQTLRDECILSPLFNYQKEFEAIGDEISKEKVFAKLSRDEILAKVYSEAEVYYKKIWTTCKQKERFVLARFSEDWFINVDNDDTIVRLLDKGLIVRSPDLRMFNSTFALYVNKTSELEPPVPVEEAKKVRGWGFLQGSFFVVLILLVFFLFGTQKEIFNSTITFVSAAAALLPALFRLLGSFSGGRGGTPSNN